MRGPGELLGAAPERPAAAALRRPRARRRPGRSARATAADELLDADPPARARHVERWLGCDERELGCAPELSCRPYGSGVRRQAPRRLRAADPPRQADRHAAAAVADAVGAVARRPAAGRDSTSLLIFVVGTVLMRSAGCAINDYADRNFDAHVERTRDAAARRGRDPRPGRRWRSPRCSPRAAFLPGAVPQPARDPALRSSRSRSPSPIRSPSASSPLPQACLGIAFGFGIPMAFAAIADALPGGCWVLFAANVFWAFAYDTEYAMVDRDDDAEARHPHLGDHARAASTSPR